MPNFPWSVPGPNDDAHPDHPRGGSTPVGHKIPGDHLIGQEADPRRNEEIDQLSPGQREPAKPTRTVQIQWLGLAVGQQQQFVAVAAHAVRPRRGVGVGQQQHEVHAAIKAQAAGAAQGIDAGRGIGQIRLAGLAQQPGIDRVEQRQRCRQ